MSRRLSRPSGHPPPEHIVLGSERIDLKPVAELTTERFLDAFPDELDRYADPDRVREWCEHDTRHLIGWAAAEVRYGSPLAKQLDWLGTVLESRGYPVARLADTLEIAAGVLVERAGAPALPVADVLRRGSEHVRATPSFLAAPRDDS